MSFTSNVSSTHCYRRDAEVNFFLNDRNALTVTIDTDRLHMRSVEDNENDCQFYASLFGDQDVMKTFATGKTKTPEEIASSIRNLWAKRWAANEPYAALVVAKSDTDEPLGHVVLGRGDGPGESELAYLFQKTHWNKGFGTEAVTAVVKEYAPATVFEGYTVQGEVLQTVKATARTDNIPSIKILEKAGMERVGEEEKHGALRHLYAVSMKELIHGTWRASVK